MSREKQIDEMARDICECYCDDGRCYQDDKPCDLKCEHFTDAQYLYAKGYRKQKEGEWKHPPYAPFGGSYEMKRCSVCGYKPDFDSDNPYTKFCPNCGAKMKGDSK